MSLVWERKNTRVGSRPVVVVMVVIVVCPLVHLVPPLLLPLPPLLLLRRRCVRRRRCCVRSKIWATSIVVYANKPIVTKCLVWRLQLRWRKRQRARPVKVPAKVPVKFQKMRCARQQRSTRLTTVTPFSLPHHHNHHHNSISNNNHHKRLLCFLCHLFVMPPVPPRLIKIPILR